MARLLLVDDEPAILAILTTLLSSNGHECITASNGQEALDLLDKESFDLMTSDMRMPVMDGLDLLRQARKKGHTLPVVMMTAFATVEAASETLKLGVYDYIRKPFKIDSLMDTINGALASGEISLGESTEAPEALPRAELKFGILVAESAVMKQACDMIERVGPTGAPAIIYGEKGTEKELVAKALHDISPRKDGPMLSLDLSALSEADIEHFLFGGGDGADGEGHGALELSTGGTLLLDFVEGLPFDVQEKLLLFLKEQVINPGTPSEKALDVRVLGGADNAQLDELVRTNKFKRDLQMRLSVIRINIPPLRERPEDVVPLARDVLEKAAEREVEIDPGACAKIQTYPWPGNYAEINELIIPLAEKLKDGVLTSDMLPEALANLEVPDAPAKDSAADDTHIRGKNLKEFLSHQLKQQ